MQPNGQIFAPPRKYTPDCTVTGLCFRRCTHEEARGIVMFQMIVPQPLVERYLERVDARLSGLPVEVRQRLLEETRARIELELEIRNATPTDTREVEAVLGRLGSPEQLGETLVRSAGTFAPDLTAPRVEESGLTTCRSCMKEVSREALTCPHCGAPHPARQNWQGWGYEWKSKQTVCGLPLVHVAFGRDKEGKIRVAKGVVAVGQFAVGAITIAQFGVGAIFGLGQFVAAPLAIGQFALGLAAIGQIAIGLAYGLGQFATGIWHTDMRNLFGSR